MPNSITIRRPERSIRATVALPRSKSVANRALILASLAGDLQCVQEPGDADDTRVLFRLLTERPRVMHCGEGGTTFRFLLAWACVQVGEERIITGGTRLLERPHSALIDALHALGADITRTEEGFRVRGRRMQGGAITIDSPVSSQFISALLLVAPHFSHGMQLTWSGRRLSAPYVTMTIKALAHFGVQALVDDDMIHVPSSTLKAAPFTVPRDWSAAAFWFGIVALSHSADVLLEQLFADRWQGDEAALELWNGCVRATLQKDGLRLRSMPRSEDAYHRSIDLTATPDLFQPLAFTHAALGLRTAFTGLYNLPLKETDRVAAVAEALARFGVDTSFSNGTFDLHASDPDKWPSASLYRAFHPRNDHRMAMSLAPLALVLEEITILDPNVVNKSYPGFWDDLRSAGFMLSTDDADIRA